MMAWLVALVISIFGGMTTTAPTHSAMAATATRTCAYDESTTASVDSHKVRAVGAGAFLGGDARNPSASPPMAVRGSSTTPSAGSVATKAAGLGDEAAGLLGNADDVVVLGRQADTAVAKGWDGHVVLDTPNWSLELNDAFIQGAIDQGRKIYLASPTTGNLVQTTGQFAGQPTVFARELNMLRDAGYVRVGDYMVPG
jgi:hypothetical protein